jgi:hypothetical protein
MHFFKNKSKLRILTSTGIFLVLYTTEPFMEALSEFLTKKAITDPISFFVGIYFSAMALISFFFLQKYNGKQGLRWNKYIFYVFYPAHLLLLGLLAN